jgi:hypothetical protein
MINYLESRALLSKTRRLLLSSNRLLRYLNDPNSVPNSRDKLPPEAPLVKGADRCETISKLD